MIVVAVQRYDDLSGSRVAVSACVLQNQQAHLYTEYQELIHLGTWSDMAETLHHLSLEGRYEWTYLVAEPGDLLQRGLGGRLYRNGRRVRTHTVLPDASGTISEVSLRLFNELLRQVHAEQPDMCDALETSFYDGYFRAEVDKLLEHDPLGLDTLAKEIITRVRVEGISYLTDQPRVKAGAAQWWTNHLFRRLFNAERQKYISF